MRIVCPNCHAAYKVDAVIKNAILVCHKCNTEFDTYGNKVTEESETTQQFKKLEENAPTFGLYDMVQSGVNNRNSQIWLAMSIVLSLIIITGVISRWDHWQYNSFARAFELRTDLSAKIIDRDWRIIPDSVSMHWLERDDKSFVLLVEGEVENLVSTLLPAPEIRLTFVTQTGKNIVLTQPITEPTELATFKAVPFSSPAIDKVPVAATGSRGFLLLVEDPPLSTQHVLLHAFAVQRKGASML